MFKGASYLVIGDSTTYYNVTGSGDSSNGKLLYCYRLAQWIRDNYAPIHLVHKGLAGYSTTDILAVFNNIMASTIPDLVTIGAGVNDPYKSVSTSQTQSNIQTMITRLKKLNPNVQIILLTPSTIVAGNTVNGSQTDSSCTSIRSLYDTIASQYTNVGVCHTENAWATSDTAVGSGSTNTYDKLHPNGTGHGAIFNLLQPIVQSQASSLLSSLGSS